MQEHFTFTYEEPQPVDWTIDDHTRTIGREGVATARAILHESRSSSMASAA